MKISKLIAPFMLLMGFQVNANIITIGVDTTSVAVGESVNVSLMANFDDAVDAIDFNFNFDNTLFTFIDGSQSTDLPNDNLFNYFMATPNAEGLGLGFTSLFESVSGSFLFASFQLERTQLGEDEFSLESSVFDNAAAGESYVLEAVSPLMITNAVSSPAAFGILLLGCAAVVRQRRKAP